VLLLETVEFAELIEPSFKWRIGVRPLICRQRASHRLAHSLSTLINWPSGLILRRSLHLGFREALQVLGDSLVLRAVHRGAEGFPIGIIHLGNVA
jgi:hypothetical protein